LSARLRPPVVQVRDLRHQISRMSLTLAHNLRARLVESKTAMAGLESGLRNRAAAVVAARRHQLAEMAARLDSLSPLRVLERGYAVVRNERDSRVVVDSSTVEVGDELQIRLMKGKLRARTIAREV